MSDENKIQINDTPYTKEAEYIKAVNRLIEKLELALDNDMEIRPYKLRELINDVKHKKAIMLNSE